MPERFVPTVNSMLCRIAEDPLIRPVGHLLPLEWGEGTS